ncbi:sensor histidine kinase [Thermomonas sp.]|uniref:sensor histidine kinase n=1 Tax=Thermomonas sp. TaxID=1971895 RepID=UPI0035B3842B
MHPIASLRRWMAPAPDSAVADALRSGRSPWAEGVHLLWSVWVFLTPLFGGGFTARWAVLTGLSYPLFLWLYAMVLLAPAHAAKRYALGMVALCLALLPWYPAGLSYFVFGCVMLHTGRRQLALLPYLGQVLALNAVYIVAAWQIGYPWQMWVWVPAMTLVIGIIVNVEHTVHAREAALRLSQDEVRRLAATAERERIGRDLHDLLGHTLSLIALKLELARKLADRDAAASRLHLEEAERVARHALAEVRSAVTGIRAVDLAAELASARLMLDSSQVALDYQPPPASLPPELEAGLALVLREAVTNIARHARARHARVAFARSGEMLELRIEDDGRGGIDAEGNGIAGMRDRIRALGGSLLVHAPRGGGTRLQVRVPWREAARSAFLAGGDDASAMPVQQAAGA